MRFMMCLHRGVIWPVLRSIRLGDLTLLDLSSSPTRLGLRFSLRIQVIPRCILR